MSHSQLHTVQFLETLQKKLFSHSKEIIIEKCQRMRTSKYSFLEKHIFNLCFVILVAMFQFRSCHEIHTLSRSNSLHVTADRCNCGMWLKTLRWFSLYWHSFCFFKIYNDLFNYLITITTDQNGWERIRRNY